MNAYSKHDIQHGRIRYALYDTEQQGTAILMIFTPTGLLW